MRARGREWVVLPESEGDLLVLRPLGGTDDEVAGILPALEPVEPAPFALPDPRDPRQIGDYRSARLLRDAVRLGFRSSAGPFRSFAAHRASSRGPTSWCRCSWRSSSTRCACSSPTTWASARPSRPG